MTELVMIARQRPYVMFGVVGLALIFVVLASGVVVNTVPARDRFVWQVVTGLLLTSLVLYQWVLLFLRLSGKHVPSQYRAHRWVGVACTALFAFHALSFGYGWTKILVIVFILSAVTGLLNREVIAYRKPWAYKLWYWSHVTLSVNLAPLIAVHIWVALAYEG